MLDEELMRSVELLDVEEAEKEEELIMMGLGNLDSSKSIHASSSMLEFCFSVRFRVCLLLCGAMFAMQYMNISMGMSIISMVEPPNIHNDSQNHTFHNSSYFHTLDWSSTMQGLILSSLSWGRLFTPLTGMLCDRFNIKILIGIGVSGSGIATLFIPTSSQLTAYLVMLCRVATGLGDAVVQPAVNRYIAIWFPRGERNMAVSLATGGRQMAIIAAFPLAGYISSRKDLLGGWPIVFYSAAGFCCLWLPFWLAWANQTPHKHKCISDKEKRTISHNKHHATKGTIQSTPWLSMLKSAPLWANIFAIVCHEIPLNVVFIFLPTYMRDVLHFNIKENGLLSGIPAAAFLAAKLVSGPFIDVWLRKRPMASRTIATRLVNSIACMGLGGFLFGTSFFTCENRTTAVSFLAVAIAFAGLHTPGCISNLVSIAPPYVGTISGLTFFCIGVTSILNPVIVKTIVVEGTPEEWKCIFYALIALALAPLIFFNIWGSAKVQPWAFVAVEKQEKSANNAEV